MTTRGRDTEQGSRLTGIEGAVLERAGEPVRSCAVWALQRETGWETTVTGRNNAERWRGVAVRRSAALVVRCVVWCVVSCLGLLMPAAHGQRGGGRAAAPHMAAAPQQRPAPRNQRQQQRMERQQRPAQNYGQQGYGRGQQNYARPYGQAGTPRSEFNGTGQAGAARPEYQRPEYQGARPGVSNAGTSGPGAGNVRPALPGNGRPYAFPPGHLGSWMNQHQNLAGQEQLLRNDPSFNRLPQADQQRLMQQLRQVNRMPADERERRLERAEAIEHMSPQERGQLVQSTRQLSALPQDRQTRVKQAFRDLRGVPVDQRQTVIDSDRYQSQFSPEERGILTNLLRAEPYEPAR